MPGCRPARCARTVRACTVAHTARASLDRAATAPGAAARAPNASVEQRSRIPHRGAAGRPAELCAPGSQLRPPRRPPPPAARRARRRPPSQWRRTGRRQLSRRAIAAAASDAGRCAPLPFPHSATYWAPSERPLYHSSSSFVTAIAALLQVERGRSAAARAVHGIKSAFMRAGGRLAAGGTDDGARGLSSWQAGATRVAHNTRLRTAGWAGRARGRAAPAGGWIVCRLIACRPFAMSSAAGWRRRRGAPRAGLAATAARRARRAPNHRGEGFTRPGQERGRRPWGGRRKRSPRQRGCSLRAARPRRSALSGARACARAGPAPPRRRGPRRQARVRVASTAVRGAACGGRRQTQTDDGGSQTRRRRAPAGGRSYHGNVSAGVARAAATGRAARRGARPRGGGGAAGVNCG